MFWHCHVCHWQIPACEKAESGSAAGSRPASGAVSQRPQSGDDAKSSPSKSGTPSGKRKGKNVEPEPAAVPEGATEDGEPKPR